MIELFIAADAPTSQPKREYAPEPWTVTPSGFIRDADEHAVAAPEALYIGDARRAITCVNACAGLSTAVLVDADLSQFLCGMADELGFMEWSSPDHAQELLQAFISKVHPYLRELTSEVHRG